MHASHDGKVEICVQLATAFPRDINAKNDIGRSALMYAAQQGHVDVCKQLIAQGRRNNSKVAVEISMVSISSFSDDPR